MFKLTIDTSNDAFVEAEHPYGLDGASEVARILHEVAEKLEAGIHDGACYDVNGNRVGAFVLKGGA